MDDSTHERRARLLAQENYDGPGRERCDREIAALFSRRLSTTDRWRYAIPACAGLAAAIVLAPLALTEPATTPWSTRSILLGFAVLGLCWFGLCWRVLRRGSVDLLTDRRRIASLALAATLLQVFVLAYATTQNATALPGLLVAIGLLIVASGLHVLQRLAEHSALQREAFLRTRLALTSGS